MKASETKLVKFLDGSKQFSIPIYQRPYSWTEPECEQLWDDIVSVAQDEKIPAHFIGSIVSIEKGLIQASDVSEFLVIDGQQRLTTISLLLAALGKNLKSDNKEDLTKNKIDNRYIFNSDESGEKRYKILLRQNDNDTFRSIIEGRDIPQEHSFNIVNNFEFFQNRIRKSEIDLDILYKGFTKLMIVDIVLDSNYDNPQLIFESLNSTGLELSQADLIRNYVLMDLKSDKQEEIYTKFWHPMEENFKHSSSLFDRFMRDYLTIKTGRIPNIREVYSSFKKYFTSIDDTIDEVISNIHRFSKFFTKLEFAREQNLQLNQIIRDINTLEVNVAYPFLLEVMDDHDKQIISTDDLIEIFLMVESYIVRRTICEIPTNSLNKTFANLAGEIDKENAYLENVKAALILKSGYRKFPNDGEFSTSFIAKNVYNLKIKKYLLDKLENHGRKERVNIDAYTIEHIMPQNENLSEGWRKELGSDWRYVHDKYLHTIGNLTLTGYNPELSDKTFLEKRDMEGGFANSPISLNAGLRSLEHWNEEEIIKRTKDIVGRAQDIWKFPKLSDDVLKRYKVPEDEDEGLDEDESAAPKWDKNVESASDEVKLVLDELISQIKDKFDCEIEPKSWWLRCCVRRPIGYKTSFAVLDCQKNTAKICFRVNPDTFQEDEHIRRVSGFFFPRGTERRMTIKKELIPKICSHLEHSYNTTNSLLDKMRKTA